MRPYLNTLLKRSTTNLHATLFFSVTHNRLPFIPVAVQGLRKVRTLYLSGNDVQQLKEKPQSRAVMASVERVYITETNLTTIEPSDFDLFPQLSELYLQRNRQLSRLSPYSFRALANLAILDLSQCHIMQLTRERFVGMSALRTLNLSHNHLATLDSFPRDLGSLVILDLSFNSIHHLSRDSLKYLSNLVRLDLRGNRLTQLLPEVLTPLHSIRAMDFTANSFTELPLEEIASVEGTMESINFEGRNGIFSYFFETTLYLFEAFGGQAV